MPKTTTYDRTEVFRTLILDALDQSEADDRYRSLAYSWFLQQASMKRARARVMKTEFEQITAAVDSLTRQPYLQLFGVGYHHGPNGTVGQVVFKPAAPADGVAPPNPAGELGPSK